MSHEKNSSVLLHSSHPHMTDIPKINNIPIVKFKDFCEELKNSLHLPKTDI